MKTKLFLFIALVAIFESSSQINFQKHTITDRDNDLTITAFTVIAADMDNDGDMDLLSASRDDDKIAWYENVDGLGTFGDQQIISTSGSSPVHMNVADIDGDGDLDVLSASQGYGVTVDPKIAWFENMDGQGTFGPEQIINIEVNLAQFVSSSDIDGDGDLDVLSASSATTQGDNKVVWYENLNGLGSFGPEQVIDIITGNGSIYHKQIHAGDLDGDGDNDVVVFTDFYVRWFENIDGAGTFIMADDIHPGGGSIKGGILTDIDDNGTIDVFINDSSFELYKNSNTNLGTFTQQPFPNSYGIRGFNVADVDNDGDNDIVGGTNTTIFWLENTDGLGNFDDNYNLIYNSGTGLNFDYRSIYAADIDNDGDIDLQSASFQQDEIAWYENLTILGNQIIGEVRLDSNSNGCGIEDQALSNVMITAQSDNIIFSTFTLDNGTYQLPVNAGSFEVSIGTSIPNYMTSNPVSAISNFIDFDNIDTINFCVENSTSINDLNVNIYPHVDDPRPGFDTSYRIVYNNLGTMQVNGAVSFEFDESKLQYLSSSEPLASQTSNSLTFNFDDLSPLGTRTIDLEFNVFAPPTTNIGDILQSSATINPVTGDETEEDNVFILEQTVIGSYDPNDITCLEGDEVPIEDADKYLHYLIRFQNTGTASAINVRVENVLDDKLDWTSMQLESLSHTGRVEILNGSEVSFIFDNINLPDSTNDEPNSHGFIAYKIKPMDDVMVGDIVNNTADIFFDFNPPITTNTASTEFVENLSVADVEGNVFNIYPNPTDDLLHINANVGIHSISVMDINGRILQEFRYNDATFNIQLDMSTFTQGIYFLQLASENASVNRKIIKR